MQIWVDADACPGEIKEIFVPRRQAASDPGDAGGQPGFVAAQVVVYIHDFGDLREPMLPDRRIVELASPNDLVITADIPLAADVVAKGACAPLNPRGELYTDANVGERLAMRNLLDDMVAAADGPCEDLRR